MQLDFQQPERFDLTYDAADGSRPRAAMIHRGTVGSMERVTAALVEREDQGIGSPSGWRRSSSACSR